MARIARTHTTATVASALRDLADVLDAMTPAKPARKTAKKAVAVKIAVAAPAKTKGASVKGEVSRKDWNRTLTTKARLAGKRDSGTSVYSLVLADWDKARTAHAAGMTPDAFLSAYVG